MHANENPSRQDRKRTARALLQARARRVRMLRRRVAAGALATFVLAFGAVVQTGTMGTTSSASSATSVTAASTATATATVSDVSDTTAAGESTDTTVTTDEPTASTVSTSQS